MIKGKHRSLSPPSATFLVNNTIHLIVQGSSLSFYTIGKSEHNIFHCNTMTYSDVDGGTFVAVKRRRFSHMIKWKIPMF